MNLKTRAKRFLEMGFFEGAEEDPQPEALAREAERLFPEMIGEAPATALLLAAGLVLEIEADAAEELDGYRQVLNDLNVFCEGATEIAYERAEFVKGKRLSAGGDENAGRVVRLRFRLDGEAHELEISHYPDLIDLSFVAEIESHLAKIKEPRRLCPILELMDDTARYVFIEPEKMQKAEEEEVISAPDFGD